MAGSYLIMSDRGASLGSQVLDLQRDALIAAGIKRSHLYEDQASGKKDDRPGLDGLPLGIARG
jgi:DNA invertase Pin-like site-specific DNA recombinase